MKKIVYSINNKGDIIERYVAQVDKNGNILTEGMENFITIDLPNGLYRPKWIGTKWIEGATQEEIDEIIKAEPSPPTAEERINALEEALLLMMMEG